MKPAPSATALPRLLSRHYIAGARASLVLALLVVPVAALSAATPRLIESLFTASIQHQVSALNAPARDLRASAVGAPEVGASPRDDRMPSAVAEVWGRFDARVEGVRAAMPKPLSTTVGPAEYYLAADAERAAPADPLLGKPQTRISLTVDPRMSTRIHFVQGRAPATMADGDDTVDIAVSAASAKRLDWAIGEVRILTPRFLDPTPLRLSGIFEAKHPHDPYWEHALSTLQPSVLDAGIGLPVVSSNAYVAPDSWYRIADLVQRGHLNLWFPVSTTSLDEATAGAVATQTRAFTSRTHGIADGTADPFGGTITTLAFASRLPATLDTAFATNAATSALLATVAAGPIFVTLVVLALSARLLAGRRRSALAILAARGATTRGVRWILALEGLLLGIPAAIVGGAVGILLTAGPIAAADLLPTAVVALVPGILLASSARPDRMRRGRADTDLPPTARFRWVVEVAIVILAVAAVVVLFQRGPTAATGIDPLLAATPLLLALAACVVVLRVYPVPLARLSRRLHSSRGLSGFLGSARSLRAPAAGLAPVLAIIVGISVTVFSCVMLSTVHGGIDTAARASVGADLSARADSITPAQLKRLRAIPSISAVAPLYAEVWSSITIDRQAENAGVLVVDTRELRTVQSGVPGAIALPSTLERTGTGRVPVVASSALVEAAGSHTIDVAFHPVTVVGTSASTIPLTVLDEWLIVDRANAKALLGEGYSPSLVLMKLRPGADPGAVERQLGSILGTDATITSPADAAAALSSNPSVSGLQVALLAAILLAGLLCAATVAFTFILATPARRRTLAILRAFGLSRRDAGALVVWELAPVAIVATVVGLLLGVWLPFVVVAGVDLRAFTGGIMQPAVIVDPWLLGLVIAGFLSVLALAASIALAATRRASTAGAVRDSEEG